MNQLDQKRIMIEDGAERFPKQATFVWEVFSFSFVNAARILDRLGSNTELINVISSVRSYIEVAELPDEDKAIIDALLQEEIEVMSFSQTSRCSVIAL